MFDFDFGIGNLEMKRAICLIFRLIKKDTKNKEYVALKEIVAGYEKNIFEYNEMTENFNKTGKL